MVGWVSLWRACHSFVEAVPVRIGFPDGKPLDDQPALLVALFSMIEAECGKEMEAMMQRGK